MTIQQFIFSNERKHRLVRHLVFWVLYCLVGLLSDLDAREDLAKNLQRHLLFFALFLPMAVCMVYIFVYVLVPQFILKKKYFSFVAAAVVTILFCFSINMIPGYLIHFKYPYPPATEAGMHWLYFSIDYQWTIHKGVCLAGGVTCIKLAKDWYLQQIENTRLAKLEAENRTRLFKSRIQPEFLFDALRGLHNKICFYPDEAPEMVVKLSDIFSYILYDCNAEHILLQKELTAVQNMVVAENMSFGDQTSISMNVHGNCDDKYIAPLTLFSFLRNQAYTVCRVESVDINIDIQDTMLDLVVQLKNVPAHLIENLETTDTYITHQHYLPSNFFNYRINKNKPGNDFSIIAEVQLVVLTNDGNSHHPSSIPIEKIQYS